METLVRQYIMAYNAKDVPGMLALLHDVIVFENVSTKTPDRTQGITATSGKIEFEAITRQSLSLFSSKPSGRSPSATAPQPPRLGLKVFWHPV